MVECLKAAMYRCYKMFAVLYVICLIIRIVIARSILRRLIVGHVVILALVWHFWNQTTAWSERRLPAPRSTTDVDFFARSDHNIDTLQVGRNDILVATRPNKGAFAYRHLVNFHGGNVRLQKLVSKNVDLFLDFCIPPMSPHFCRQLLESLTNTLTNNDENRFYREDPVSGDLLQMETDEARTFVQHKLLLHWLYPSQHSLQACPVQFQALRPKVFDEILSAELISSSSITAS